MSLKEVTVTRKEAADLLGYTEGYLNELVKEQGLPKDNYNKYPLVDLIKWHIDYLSEKHKRELAKIASEKPADLNQLRSAELKQVMIEEKRRTLVPAAEVREKWLTQIQVIVTNLDGVPYKEAGKILGLNDTNAAVQALTEIIDGLKDRISKIEIES